MGDRVSCLLVVILMSGEIRRSLLCDKWYMPPHRLIRLMPHTGYALAHTTGVMARVLRSHTPDEVFCSRPGLLDGCALSFRKN